MSVSIGKLSRQSGNSIGVGASGTNKETHRQWCQSQAFSGPARLRECRATAQKDDGRTAAEPADEAHLGQVVYVFC